MIPNGCLRQPTRSKALVLVLVAVIATSAAGAVATNVVEYDTHTTDSDFNGATLDNMTVTGSGADASVVAGTDLQDIAISNPSAPDGNSTSYDLTSYTTSTDPEVVFTGVTQREWDNVTASDVQDGDTVTVDVAGNADPSGPSANDEPTVTIAGSDDVVAAYLNEDLYLSYVDSNSNVVNSSIAANDVSAIGDFNGDGDNETVIHDPNDNLEIVDGAGNINDLGVQATSVGYVGDIDDDGDLDIAYRRKSDDYLHIVDSGGDTTNLSVEIYGVGDMGDVEADGDLEVVVRDKSDNIVAVDSAGNINDLNVQGTNVGGVGDFDDDNDVDVVYQRNLDWLYSVDDSGNDVNLSVKSILHGGVGYMDRLTEDASIDIDGDGTDEVTHTGPLNDSGVTFELSSLSTADDNWGVSVGNGVVGIDARFREVTKSDSPSFEVNDDNWLNHSGVLDDGESVTISGSSSWLRTGTNYLNLTLPSLSADAPPMLVQYNYSHLARTDWATASYASANYSVTNSTEVRANVTLDDANVTLHAEYWTGSAWQSLGSKTVTTNGSHTVDYARTTETKVRVRAAYESHSGSGYGALHSDSIYFLDHSPTLSNFDPGNETVYTESPTLSVDVDDDEFSDVQGDNVTVEFYVDGSKIGEESLTSAGTASIQTSGLSDANHTWQAVATDDYGVSTTGTHEFSVEHPAPVVSNPSPTGGLDAEPTQLEVTVNDTDFAYDGDSLDVEFSLDGSVIDTQTINSNQTVTTSIPASGQTGGTHDWSVRVDDNYGSTTTANYTYSTPDKLYIRNESDPDTLIDNATVDVRFFGENDISTRSTSNGTLNMTGLPTGETFVVTAEADGYYDRRIIVDSLFEQQSIYLLNESVVSAVAIDFAIDDATGQYSDENTTLLIQRPLNRSGTTNWETIVGSQIGGNREVPTILEQDVRYRIIVRNRQDGVTRQRVLGSYIASGPADPEVLPIGRIEISGDVQAGTVFGAELLNGTNGRFVRVEFRDAQDATDDLDLEICRVSNTSQCLQANTTYSGPFGVYKATYSVPASAPANVSYYAEWHATRSNASDVGGNVTMGSLAAFPTTWGIDPDVLSLMGWVLITAIAGLTVIVDSRRAAGMTAIVGAALAVFGVVAINPVLVSFALGAAVLFNVAGGTR